jgi:hypothetical protein
VLLRASATPYTAGTRMPPLLPGGMTVAAGPPDGPLGPGTKHQADRC